MRPPSPKRDPPDGEGWGEGAVLRRQLMHPRLGADALGDLGQM
jgi:hypothetical protein